MRERPITVPHKKRTANIISFRRVACNIDRSIRHRFGSALRTLASTIDGRLTLAIEIETIPRVSNHQLSACISRAIDDMDRYIKIEHQAEVEEATLRKLNSELFKVVD